MSSVTDLSVPAAVCVRVVVRVESEAHEVRRAVRSVQASVSRAGGAVTALDLIDDRGNRIDSDVLSETGGVGRFEPPDSRRLLLVMSSTMLLSDDLVSNGIAVLRSDASAWVFPEFVSDFVAGMGHDVFVVPDTVSKPHSRWEVIDGIRHPRCVLLSDDERSASVWSDLIDPARWPETVLGHLVVGGHLRVARHTMLLARAQADLSGLHHPDQASMVALANHPFFEAEVWAGHAQRRSPPSADQPKDSLGRLLQAARSSPLSGRMEGRRLRGMRAAVRGALREWSSATAAPPATLADIPDLVRSVHRLNEVDQQVHPMHLTWMVPTDAHGSWVATAFREFLERFPSHDFSDVFIRPAFEIGGVEVVVLDLARVLAGAGANCLVIATDVGQSALSERVGQQGGVELWMIDADPRAVADGDVAHLIAMTLARMAPETVTVCDSERGFAAWFAAPSLKSSGTRLHYQDYSVPWLDGLPYEHVASAPRALDAANLVITDSHAHRKHIQSIYGVPDDRFLVLSHPVHPIAREKRSGLSRRVLWAGRLSYEKRPEVAIAAVKELAALGIEMEMYGPRDEGHALEIGLDRALDEAHNVEYKGVYQSLDELDFDRFDILIIPSVQEGLPHAAIEGVFANLFLVVADVGGLPEAVSSDSTGTVVSDSGVDGYIEAITEFYSNSALHDPESRRQRNSLVRHWHTRESFETAVLRAFRPEVSR